MRTCRMQSWNASRPEPAPICYAASETTKAPPISLPNIRLASATGVSYFASWTRSTRSTKPTSGASQTRSSSTATAPAHESNLSHRRNRLTLQSNPAFLRQLPRRRNRARAVRNEGTLDLELFEFHEVEAPSSRPGFAIPADNNQRHCPEPDPDPDPSHTRRT